MGDDIEAVTAVLKSDFLTQGQAVPAFEQAVASKTGAGFALATNSATSALHIACLALGLQSGDLLWTTPITFVASANCARYCGADVKNKKKIKDRGETKKEEKKPEGT